MNDSMFDTAADQEHWVLVMPCGHIDGTMRVSDRNHDVESTWKTFTRLKRDRDREKKQGWVLRIATPADIAGSRIVCGCENQP